MKGNLIVITLGRVLQVLISFATLKVVTNYLSPGNVAYYFLFLSILNYFGLSFISPAGQYVNRQLHPWKKDKVLFNRLFNHSLYIFAVSVIAAPAIYLASKHFGLLDGLNSLNIALLVGLGVLFNTAISTIVPTFNMLGYQVTFVIFTVCWLLLSLVLSVFYIHIGGEDIFNWFLGQISSQALVSIIAFFVLKHFTKEKLHIKEAISSINAGGVRSALKFALPLILSTLLMWGATDSFRFVLEKTHGLEYVGLFSVGLAIAQRFSYAVESIAQQVFYPTFYSKMNLPVKERSLAWHKMFYSSLPLYLVTTLMTVVLSPLLITIFSGPQYKEAVPFVICGALFHLFRKLTANFSMIAHSEMKTKMLILPYSVGALFSSLGVYLFSFSNFHLPGIILVLGGFMMFVTMIYKTSSALKFKWDSKQAVEAVTIWFKFKRL